MNFAYIVGILTFCLICIFSTTFVWAEETETTPSNDKVKQEIIVTNDGGSAIEGAVFEIRNQNQDVLETVTTDAKGVGNITKVDDGTYVLVETKTADGYNVTETNNAYVVKAAQPVQQTQIVNKAVSASEVSDQSTQTESVSPIQYQAHVKNEGWLNWVNNGETGGTTGKNERMEALKIKSNIDGVGVSYKAHVANVGWQDSVIDGEEAGTTGKKLQIEALQISLTGSNASQYNIYYRVHVKNFGWLGWAKNGEIAGSVGYGMQVEAVEIKLISTDTQFDTGSNQAALSEGVQYQVHGQDYGWQDYKTQGAIAGIVGQSKRIEAIKITKSDDSADIGFEYNTHLQNVGWQGWKSDNTLSGTTGESRRMEAIQIKLTGSDAGQYDVYYRVHVQNLGWLGWAKNGEMAGSSAYGYRMEAIQIKLIPKGSITAPSTGNSYQEKTTVVNSGDTGIDVSEWNGYGNDWNAAKSNDISFAFIRTGWGRSGDGRADYAFSTNYENAKSAGMPIGVYHYSYATTVEEARQEAQLCLNILGGRDLDLPVAFDVEDEATTGQLSSSEVSNIINAFCETIQSAGYTPMVYANLNWYTNKMDFSQINQYKIWLAQYNDEPTFSQHFDVWQYSSQGSVNGIGGSVDMNRAYSDF